MSESVSIIICSKDRRRVLEKAVLTVRKSGPACAAAEIVVVEETDRPEPIADVKYVTIPRHHRGFGYARITAVQAATGAILLFIDDDCEANEGWGEALLAPFEENPDVLGVAGAVAVHECGLIGYAENILGFPGGTRGPEDAADRLENEVRAALFDDLNAPNAMAALFEFIRGANKELDAGGIDLVFPHHEDEIAQSEAATGKPFARCWCHGEFLLTDGAKMAKRVGNVQNVEGLRENGISGAAVRHFVFSTHYRKQLTLAGEALEGPLEAVRRVLKPSGTLWVSGTQHVIFSIGFAMQELGYHLLNTVTWYKPNASPRTPNAERTI